jgi:hypothetical protein
LHEIFNQADSAHIAALLPEPGNSSDRVQRSGARLLGGHSRGDVLFGQLIEMKAKFGFELALHGATAE